MIIKLLIFCLLYLIQGKNKLHKTLLIQNIKHFTYSFYIFGMIFETTNLYIFNHMIMKRNIFLFTIAFATALLQPAFAQPGGNDDPNKNVPPRLQKQQDDFDSGNYMFPAQKRSNWAVGVMLGGAFQSADVKNVLGYGLGVNVQKALGHTFSIRGQATGGVITGQNYQFSRGYFSGKQHGNAWANMVDVAGNRYWANSTALPNRVYYNYRMNWYDASIQGVANLNNINFYKEQNKFGLYAAAGVGFSMYNVMVDALNSDLLTYNFDNVPKLKTKPTLFDFNFFNKTPGTKQYIKDSLYDIRGVKGNFDNLKKSHYESLAEGHLDEQGINLGKVDVYDPTSRTITNQKKYYVWNPFINASFGVVYRFGRRVELGFEHRLAWTNDDLLEGQRWQENGARPGFGNTALTRDFDAYHFSAIVCNFRLGKGEESMWWVNPLASIYGSVADTKKLVKGVSEDADNDGVPDIFDQEPDTPENTLVDSKGRTLDSDEDGVPDSQDTQKFSPKDCPVDENGKVVDADADNVPDCYDQELNSAADAYVDAKGRTIPAPVIPKFDCKDCFPNGVPSNAPVAVPSCDLPTIHFDLDRANIKNEFYPDMYFIARFMMDNPGKRIRVMGYTDKGGEAMITKRIDNAINFLVGNFGIDRSRFETAYGANANGAAVYTGGSGSGKSPQNVQLDYLNRRVEFQCVD